MTEECIGVSQCGGSIGEDSGSKRYYGKLGLAILSLCSLVAVIEFEFVAFRSV